MIPIRLKAGVGLAGMSVQTLLVALVAAPIWEKHGAKELVLTSVNDSWEQHVMQSKHHRGDAVDFRTKNFPGGAVGPESQRAAHELRDALGRDYDVVWKPNHVHCQYYPRRPV